MREQPVSSRQIDDAAAAEDAADTPRHLPRFVQFFSRQATRVAHGARQTIEERVCQKPPQVVVGKAVFGRDGERRILQSPLILLQLIDAIDHQHFHDPAARIELEAELLLQRGKD